MMESGRKRGEMDNGGKMKWKRIEKKKPINCGF
jgi:hypothetical protein